MMMPHMLRLNLWSLPRCCSTSLMYSFAQRPDFKVFDEPLYAAYLHQHPNEQRPYREMLLKEGLVDGNQVVREVIMGNDYPGKHRFYKHISSMLMDSVDKGFMKETDHLFLIRHPYRVVASYYKTHGSVSVHSTGLPGMIKILELLQKIGYEPLIINNYALLDEPEPTLKRICAHFHLPFEPKMLSWPKGGIPEDGLWANYWYHGTHQSTSFVKSDKTLPNEELALQGLPDHVIHEAKLCLPLYETLSQK